MMLYNDQYTATFAKITTSTMYSRKQLEHLESV